MVVRKDKTRLTVVIPKRVDEVITEAAEELEEPQLLLGIRRHYGPDVSITAAA